MHTDNPREGLRHVVEMDDMIRHVSSKAGKDTLILFTADHSFALRMLGGERGTPYAQQYARARRPGGTGSHPLISVVDDHTGEEVLAVASGPGAERLHGFIPNTRLFEVMMAALGWTADR
jgi:alkaline phosphatase